MIIEYIRYELKEHSAEALVDAYRVAGTALQAAPECLGFDLALCAEDAKVAVLRIRWRSAEAHMEGFRKSAHFRSFFAAVRPFVGEIAEMRHYQPTDVEWGGPMPVEG
jgi:quinol monooxygenase YgiN